MQPRISRARLEQYLTMECLTGREIAQREGVSMATAYRYCRLWGMRPADRFWRTFETRHGPGAQQKFLRLQARGLTYAAIGRLFGFSREYARLVGQRLDGREDASIPALSKGASCLASPSM